MRILPVAVAASLTALAVATPSTARADDPKYDFRGGDDAPKDSDKPFQTKANISVGASWISGNGQSFGLTGSGDIVVRIHRNQLEFFAQGAYARAGVQPVPGGPFVGDKVVAQNWLERLRYDRYLTKHNTVFAAAQLSSDPLGGIEWRLEPQLGYARILYESAHQLFRGELGGDFAHESYVPGAKLDHDDFISGRAFLYYENKFTTYASFTESVEAIEAFNKPEHFRLNSFTTLSSALTKSVSLKLSYTIKFNFDPPSRPAPATGKFEIYDSVLEAALAITLL